MPSPSPSLSATGKNLPSAEAAPERYGAVRSDQAHARTPGADTIGGGRQRAKKAGGSCCVASRCGGGELGSGHAQPSIGGPAAAYDRLFPCAANRGQTSGGLAVGVLCWVPVQWRHGAPLCSAGPEHHRGLSQARQLTEIANVSTLSTSCPGPASTSVSTNSADEICGGGAAAGRRPTCG